MTNQSKILNVQKFNKLENIDKLGKKRTWNIYVEESIYYSEIIIVFGLDRFIESRRRINTGKNIGKKNETTHFQQAVREAKSKWQKKKDIEQYTEQQLNKDKDKENYDETVPLFDKQNSILPMLAKDYNKQKKNVKFPVLIQPKLDGYRCIYNTNTKLITTRQGKEFSIVKQSGILYNELKFLPKGYILDGELYVHDPEAKFEDLGILRKTKKLTNDELVSLSKIEYYIYDVIDCTKTFKERNEILKNLLNSQNTKMIKYVETKLVNSEEKIKEAHIQYVNENYEGTMIRNIDGMYIQKFRSPDLLKYKDFMDSEFEISDFTFEKDTTGTDINLIVWIINVPLKIVLDGHVCEKNLDIRTEKNKHVIKVKVRPMGTKEERTELYKQCINDFSQFKGKNLWTKFFEYTGDGSLRFPSTMRNTYIEYIRDTIL